MHRNPLRLTIKNEKQLFRQKSASRQQKKELTQGKGQFYIFSFQNWVISPHYITFAARSLTLKEIIETMLKTILSISGRPGLFKLISQGKNMLIVESLVDNKRVPAYAKDKVIALGDIAIYTTEAEVPLHEVLTSIREKEQGEKIAALPGNPDGLRAYLAEVLPDFDRERVYPSDIKKLLGWYNILVGAGLTNFTPEKEEKAEETAEEKAAE